GRHGAPHGDERREATPRGPLQISGSPCKECSLARRRTVRLHFRTGSLVRLRNPPPSMKEYRPLAWPELPAEDRRTAHRRALSEMSQRVMSLAKLVEVSGLK